MKVAVFTGPTGGHFFPALAFCEALQRRHPASQFLWVTSERGRGLVERMTDTFAFRFEYLPEFPLPRLARFDFLVSGFPFLVKLVRSFAKTERLLNEFRPDLCVGFGSYVSAPGILTGWRRGIPRLIHEQNRTLGKANRWLLNFVDGVALSFERHERARSGFRFRVVGFPLRSDLLQAASEREQRSEPFHTSRRCQILVVGGSQGASALNTLWRRTVEPCSDEEKSKMAVIHITGERDSATMRDFYENQGIPATVFSFHNHIEELYRDSDLALTRAGAGTLFELAAFRLPAIVIPYPHAGRHQERNARFFENSGGLQVLLENQVTPHALKACVMDLVDSPERRREMSQNLEQFQVTQAADRLVDWAEELCVRKEVGVR